MMAQLSSNWLDLAVAHGATKWVKQFLSIYLPQIQEQTLSIQDFAQALEEQLLSRQLTTPAQQKNYRSNVVQAIKTIDPDHKAIALVSLTTEEYQELNDAQRGKLANRETRYFTSDQAQTLVERATALLDSAEWSAVGAGLAVLIGRRISEILLSEFALATDWSLQFSEMAKKKDTEGLTLEIPTLAPAEKVLKAIERLQRGLHIEDLKLNSLSPKMAKQTVNGRYSEPVAAKCVEHFSDLTPLRSDRDNLYTHIFRAVYATIAAHWFCPTSVPEHLYKAEIQGHFTLAKSGGKLPNYSARANYDDYVIGTPDGNRDGRLGIKLGQLPGLAVIEAFRKEIPIRKTIDDDKNENEDKEVVQIGDRLNDSLQPTEAIAKEDFPVTEAITKKGDSLVINSTQNLTVEPITEDFPVINSTQNPTVESLTEDSPVSNQIPKPTIESLVAETNSVSQPTQKGKTKRPELYANDLVKMTELMAKRGVVGSTAEVFQALLDAFETGQQQQSQTIGEVAQTLNWFTTEIQSLRVQVNQLEQERDRALADRVDSDVGDRLRAENAQLKRELQQSQSRLEGIEKLLGKGREVGLTSVTDQEAVSIPVLTSPSPSPTPVAASEKAVSMSVEATTQPSQTPSEGQVRTRHRGDTTEKIHHIVDALVAWNQAQPDSQSQLRISIPTIKAIASAMGVNYQPAIQQVLKAREAELEEHHSRLLLGTRHNASVIGKDDIIRAISRDYLGLNNWEIVK